MNDDGVINLKNLRKPTPPPSESYVAPVRIAPSAPAAMMTPPAPPAAPRMAPAAPQMQRPAPRQFSAGTREPSNWNWPKIGITAVIVGVVVIGIGYYIYTNIWTRSPFGPTPGAAAQTETSGNESQAASAGSTASGQASAAGGTLTVEDIIRRVGQLMLLPDNEMPTLAGVSDPNSLGDQAFFKNAKTGDVVLMYGTSRRAILYDPIANKIIEVAPITDATSTQP